VVRVIGSTSALPARDQWVTVTGTFDRLDGNTPTLAALTVTPTSAPADPYE